MYRSEYCAVYRKIEQEMSGVPKEEKIRYEYIRGVIGMALIVDKKCKIID